MEFYLMIMVTFVLRIHGLTGHGTESMIVAVVTFLNNAGTSGYFIYVFLLFMMI